MSFTTFRIGNVHFVEKLDGGGRSEVFRADVQERGTIAIRAVKRVLAAAWSDPAARTNFEEEAKAVPLPRHPNLVHTQEILSLGDTRLIIMEYVHGKDLGTLLEEVERQWKRLPIELSMHLAIELCAGAAHLVRARKAVRPGATPRDLSPRNILLSYDGKIRLLDRAMEPKQGNARGSLFYLSPEQARGAPTDERSEVFSVCLLLYELLTGRKPFFAENDGDVLRQVQSCRISPPREYNPEIPEALETSLMKGLHNSREDRFRDLLALQSSLSSLFPSLTSSYSAKDVGAVVAGFFPTPPYPTTTTVVETKSPELVLSAREEERLREKLQTVPVGLGTKAAPWTSRLRRRVSDPVPSGAEKSSGLGALVVVGLIGAGAFFWWGSGPPKKLALVSPSREPSTSPRPAETPFAIPLGAPRSAPRPRKNSGFVELWGTSHMDLYMDGTFMTRLPPDEKLKLSITAGKVHRFRFVDVATRASISRNYSVQGGDLLTDEITFKSKKSEPSRKIAMLKKAPPERARPSATERAPVPTTASAPNQPSATDQAKLEVAKVERDYAYIERDQGKQQAQAWRAFKKGQIAFRYGAYEKALQYFRESRSHDPGYVASYISEMRTLSALDRGDEARVLALNLVERNPKYRNLNVIDEFLP